MDKLNTPGSINIDKLTFGELCSILAETNFYIYEYENKKWWNRKNGTATDKDINMWDEASRAWNEMRSRIKNKIDLDLKNNFSASTSKIPDTSSPTRGSSSFQVLPISLMIDMLTIENIKIFDLKSKKGRQSDITNATSKKRELERSIEEAIVLIAKKGQYDLKPESRTF